ncbi:MAG: acyltransferase [Erythrobacter sp.]|uniref:acyltransferase family protein n=1 Tax=Erythrobacter sp. TaxID=1042 RepID=UPI0032EC5F9C
MRESVDQETVIASSPTFRHILDSQGNRGPGFDTVRLLAASAVALHHSLGIQIDAVKDDLLFQFSHGYTHLGLLAVAVFFAISGFLVTPGLIKSGNVLEYLSRRFMRIMPLLFVVVLATALILGPLLSSLSLREYFASGETWSYLRNVTTSLQLRLPGVTNHIGTNSINNPLWTLRYEWLCYILIAFASMALILRHRLLFVLAWAAALLAYPLLYGFDEAEGKGSLGTLMYLFGYFGAGAVLSLYAEKVRWSPALLWASFAAITVTFYLDWSHLIAPVLITYFVIGLGLVRMPWSAFLQRADLSYGVYLTHALVLTVLMNLYGFENPIALFAVCMPVTLTIAWLTWTFIEEPALKLKSLPAELTRSLLYRIPFGTVLLYWLEPAGPPEGAPNRSAVPGAR